MNIYHLNTVHIETTMIITLRLRQNGCHFTDDIFKCIFLNENVSIAIKISLKFVPKGPINNIPALVQIMAWRHPGDKSLSEPMMVSLPTHICVTRPQWVMHSTIWIGNPFKTELKKNMKINLNFLSFLNTKMAQVVKIPPCGCWEPVYPI